MLTKREAGQLRGIIHAANRILISHGFKTPLGKAQHGRREEWERAQSLLSELTNLEARPGLLEEEDILAAVDTATATFFRGAHLIPPEWFSSGAREAAVVVCQERLAARRVPRIILRGTIVPDSGIDSAEPSGAKCV